MILSQNYHSPISFWLSIPLKDLSAWIGDSNELVEEQRERNKK